MLGPVDHVGYLASDLEASVAVFVELLGAPVARPFERPEFSVIGVYLGVASGDIEVFSFTDENLANERLDGSSLLLDHVAYEVSDIDGMATAMKRDGVRFSGPDFREELHEAVDLGGVRHLWTVPETCHGLSLQLLQR
jgi:catechol 2,3-dioxygenase-like lactoylglutathione lyase family enzyme